LEGKIYFGEAVKQKMRRRGWRGNAGKFAFRRMRLEGGMKTWENLNGDDHPTGFDQGGIPGENSQCGTLGAVGGGGGAFVFFFLERRSPSAEWGAMQKERGGGGSLQLSTSEGRGGVKRRRREEGDGAALNVVGRRVPASADTSAMVRGQGSKKERGRRPVTAGRNRFTGGCAVEAGPGKRCASG